MGKRRDYKANFLVVRGDRRRIRRMLDKHPELKSSNTAQLLFASQWHNPPMMRWLLERGLSPDCREGSPNGNTVLMYACAHGNIPEIRLLLEFGANPTLCNETSEDAFGYAVTWQQLEAVKLLAAVGVDVNDTTDSGPNRTQLDIAEVSGWVEMANLLRSLGGKHYAEIHPTP